MNASQQLQRASASVACGLLITASNVAALDWSQWRGPLQNGELPQSVKLAESWPAEGPKQLWDSETIPSDDDGGHSSPVIAGNRAYLSVVWHTDVPTETRTIDELVMRQVGQQSLSGLTPELVKKMEEAREAIPPTLRGKALEDFAKKWIDENFDRKQKEFYGGFATGRFRKGKVAIPLGDYDKMIAVKNKAFPSADGFKKWVDGQGFADFVKEQLIAAVPPTKKVAEDVVVCLDLETGKTLWKAKAPGEPLGRGSSSTPCVAGGRIFAMGSTHLYAVDAQTGKQQWSAPLPAKGPGSSPLFVDGVVVILSGKLAAFDATTGEKLWIQDKVGGNNSSPVAWQKDNRTLILANGRNEIAGVDLKTGAIAWTTPGGGDSTPAVDGDTLVVLTRKAEIGLAAYRLSATGAVEIWRHPMEMVRSQSSPVINKGQVYLMEDGLHQCYDIKSGSVAWEEKAPSTITSPVLADGKIFVLVNNGNNLVMLKATTEQRMELGKANVRALWVPSPAISNGKLLLRLKDRLRCFDLAGK